MLRVSALKEFEYVGHDQTAGSSAPVKGETVAKLKVAINGFGRIGRNFLRCWHGRKNSPLDVIVVNDSGGVKNVRKLYNLMYRILLVKDFWRID